MWINVVTLQHDRKTLVLIVCTKECTSGSCYSDHCLKWPRKFSKQLCPSDNCIISNYAVSDFRFPAELTFLLEGFAKKFQLSCAATKKSGRNKSEVSSYELLVCSIVEYLQIQILQLS